MKNWTILVGLLLVSMVLINGCIKEVGLTRKAKGEISIEKITSYDQDDEIEKITISVTNTGSTTFEPVISYTATCTGGKKFGPDNYARWYNCDNPTLAPGESRTSTDRVDSSYTYQNGDYMFLKKGDKCTVTVELKQMGKVKDEYGFESCESLSPSLDKDSVNVTVNWGTLYTKS